MKRVDGTTAPTGTLDLSNTTLKRNTVTKSTSNMLFNDTYRVKNFAGDDLDIIKPCGSLATGTNLDDLCAQGSGGFYYLSSNNTYSNIPTGLTSGFLEVEKVTSSTNACVQIIYGFANNFSGVWYRTYTSSWDAWKMIKGYSSTTASVSYGGVSDTITIRRNSSVGSFSLSIYTGSNTTKFSNVTGTDTIMTLPEGYRPNATTIIPCLFKSIGGWATATYYSGAISIQSNGTVQLLANSTEAVKCCQVVGSFTYLISL